MKKLFAAGVAAFLCSTASIAQAAVEKYTIDPGHTTILFFIKHAEFSDMIGSFRKFDGTLEIDREHPENSKVQISIDPKSIQTSSAELDHKLQNEKFFNSAKHPNIHFESKTVKVEGNTAVIDGQLSMLGALNPLQLKVKMNKEGKFFDHYRIGFSGAGELKRSEYGMLEYIPTVGDNVKIQVEAEFQRVEPTKAE